MNDRKIASQVPDRSLCLVQVPGIAGIANTNRASEISVSKIAQIADDKTGTVECWD